MPTIFSPYVYFKGNLGAIEPKIGLYIHPIPGNIVPTLTAFTEPQFNAYEKKELTLIGNIQEPINNFLIVRGRCEWEVISGLFPIIIAGFFVYCEVENNVELICSKNLSQELILQRGGEVIEISVNLEITNR